MLKENYMMAKNTITSNSNKCYFVGARDENIIVEAEKVLGIKFSDTHYDFLLNYGAGSIGSEEIYGIIDNNFIESSVPDSIWYTLNARIEYKLPDYLVVISDQSDGTLFCLDYRKTHDEEPPVVMYYIGVDESVQTYKIIASDFGEYLLKLASTL